MRRPHRSRRDDQSGVRTDRATDQRAERFAAERTVLRDRCHEWARDNLPGAFYEAGARLPTSDDGYAVAIVVGGRTWRVRALFATRETAEQVADRLQAELSEHGTDHVLANHSMVRLTRGARERLHLRLH